MPAAGGRGTQALLYVLAVLFIFAGVITWLLDAAMQRTAWDSASLSYRRLEDATLGVRVLLEFLIAAVCLGSGAIVGALEHSRTASLARMQSISERVAPPRTDGIPLAKPALSNPGPGSHPGP